MADKRERHDRSQCTAAHARSNQGCITQTCRWRGRPKSYSGLRTNTDWFPIAALATRSFNMDLKMKIYHFN